MHRIALALLLGASLLVSGCSNLTHEETGGAAGAVMGVLVGSMFGSGAGKAVAMAVGGVAGGLAGRSIGRDLDEADRREAQRAAFSAANTGTGDRIVWSSQENPGVRGYAVPAGKAEVTDGELCKDVRSVYVKDGVEKAEVSRFCYRNGRWENG